ncbi:MAG: EF-hand domain-containing protein [Alphaproteobacteria bacterium]|nr:EF-hand domain-containing protein [Alphaproteobacteria bacterium]
MIRTVLVALAAAVFVPQAAAETVSVRMLDRVKQADANDDGVVSWAEFAAYRRIQFKRMDRDDGYVTQRDIDAIRMFLPRELEPDRMIANFDADGDGRISPDELADGPSPAFAVADSNGDRVVTAAEFKTAEAALNKKSVR